MACSLLKRYFFVGAVISATAPNGMAEQTLSVPCLRGVNLSGAEFKGPDGVYGKDYTYPSERTVRYFAARGMNTVRLPFKWERLQPDLNRELSAQELRRLSDSVELLTKHGMMVVLDPHNYGRYGGKIVGSSEVPNEAFADFWRRVSKAFGQKQNVIFGLMNEPHGIGPKQWLDAVNLAISEIRREKASNLVLVPGVSWSGAHAWLARSKDGINGEVLRHVSDPAGNFAFEVHQYYDKDFSGTSSSCERARGALTAIQRVTDWAKARKLRFFLGEFGVSQTDECLRALDNTLQMLRQHNDVWLGWTYWVAGDWWPAKEPFNVQPRQGERRKQMEVLERASPNSIDLGYRSRCSATDLGPQMTDFGLSSGQP
jgi:endoglucanase